jgi:hypothetical protein
MQLIGTSIVIPPLSAAEGEGLLLLHHRRCHPERSEGPAPTTDIVILSAAKDPLLILHYVSATTSP